MKRDGLGYNESQINSFLKKIHNSTYNTDNLPLNFYLRTAKILRDALYEGFDRSLKTVEFGTPDKLLLNELRDNVYLFSAAKTYTQVKDLASFIYDNDRIRPFSEYKEIVLSKYNAYNTNYLEAEYVTTLTAADNAKRWLKIEKSKSYLPIAEYVAVLDSRTSEQCRSFDGIKAPFSDPIWKRISPPNHFKCRCGIVQHEESEQLTEYSEKQERYDKGMAEMQDLFKGNSFYDKQIFKKEHPYFIEAKNSKLANVNFGLPIPRIDKK